MAWNPSDIADEIAAALERAEAELRLAQAVAGLDALGEIALQEIVAAGLSARHEVAREAHYPSSAGRKLSHRSRCDLVLSPKGRPLRLAHEPAGLFTGELCEPGEALWLEMKLARQFGEGGQPHAGYGRQWKSALAADLRKMDEEPLIRDAALAAIFFTASNEILGKDLALFEQVLAQENVLAGSREVRVISIIERIGHARCGVVLWPTLRRGPFGR